MGSQRSLALSSVSNYGKNSSQWLKPIDSSIPSVLEGKSPISSPKRGRPGYSFVKSKRLAVKKSGKHFHHTAPVMQYLDFHLENLWSEGWKIGLYIDEKEHRALHKTRKNQGYKP